MADAGRPRGWFPFHSIRARTTAGAVLIVGAALVIAAVALVAVMRNVMQTNVRDAARLRARDIAVTLKEAPPDAIRLDEDDDVFIQIVDTGGRVVASSLGLEGVEPLIEGGTEVVRDPAIDDDPFIAVTHPADASIGPVTVIVGRNLDLVVETTTVVARVLALGVPLLLLVVGITTWRVVGRALAPVESMRREVGEISAAELHRRVPDPPGDDEIARLATTMNDMLERLESARRMQQRLVSDAAHELRNPISAIRHHAEVALEHPTSTDLRSLASEVLAEDLRLQRLAEDLLLLARADENRLALDARTLDLDDLVLEEARRLRETTGLTIDTRDVSAGRVRGDPGQLTKVVQNLAENAARHAASSVRFGLRVTDGHVALEVDDDGPGVAPASRALVFERFTRLDEARDRAHGGAGLGLAIVAEIVKLHGGTATVHDAPLGGARFEVVLPGELTT
ncbi:MAG: ATP-binding protein [Actinomycetota bacterium]